MGDSIRGRCPTMQHGVKAKRAPKVNQQCPEFMKVNVWRQSLSHHEYADQLQRMDFLNMEVKDQPIETTKKSEKQQRRRKSVPLRTRIEAETKTPRVQSVTFASPAVDRPSRTPARSKDAPHSTTPSTRKTHQPEWSKMWDLIGQNTFAEGEMPSRPSNPARQKNPVKINDAAKCRPAFPGGRREIQQLMQKQQQLEQLHVIRKEQAQLELFRREEEARLAQARRENEAKLRELRARREEAQRQELQRKQELQRSLEQQLQQQMQQSLEQQLQQSLQQQRQQQIQQSLQHEMEQYLQQKLQHMHVQEAGGKSQPYLLKLELKVDPSQNEQPQEFQPMQLHVNQQQHHLSPQQYHIQPQQYQQQRQMMQQQPQQPQIIQQRPQNPHMMQQQRQKPQIRQQQPQQPQMMQQRPQTQQQQEYEQPRLMQPHEHQLHRQQSGVLQQHQQPQMVPQQQQQPVMMLYHPQQQQPKMKPIQSLHQPQKMSTQHQQPIHEEPDMTQTDQILELSEKELRQLQQQQPQDVHLPQQQEARVTQQQQQQPDVCVPAPTFGISNMRSGDVTVLPTTTMKKPEVGFSDPFRPPLESDVNGTTSTENQFTDSPLLCCTSIRLDGPPKSEPRNYSVPLPSHSPVWSSSDKLGAVRERIATGSNAIIPVTHVCGENKPPVRRVRRSWDPQCDVSLSYSCDLATEQHPFARHRHSSYDSENTISDVATMEEFIRCSLHPVGNPSFDPRRNYEIVVKRGMNNFVPSDLLTTFAVKCHDKALSSATSCTTTSADQELTDDSPSEVLPPWWTPLRMHSPPPKIAHVSFGCQSAPVACQQRADTRWLTTSATLTGSLPATEVSAVELQLPMEVSAPALQLPVEMSAPKLQLPMEVSAPKLQLPMEVSATKLQVPTKVSAPKSQLPMEVSAPKSQLPMDVSAPKSQLPMEVSAPKLQLPMELSAPMMQLPMELSAPKLQLPMEVVAPKLQLPIEVAAPKSQLSMDSLPTRKASALNSHLPTKASARKSQLPRRVWKSPPSWQSQIRSELTAPGHHPSKRPGISVIPMPRRRQVSPVRPQPNTEHNSRVSDDKPAWK